MNLLRSRTGVALALAVTAAAFWACLHDAPSAPAVNPFTRLGAALSAPR